MAHRPSTAASIMGVRRGAAACRRAFAACAVLITAAGAAVRWSFIDYPMRYDESWTYLRFTAKSPEYIATHYIPANHVLHSLLVRITIELFGDSPAALRLPSFVAGVLLVAATGWLAWELFRRRDVVLLTLIAAGGSSQLIEYSANSRGYSWFALFAVLAAIVTIKLLARSDTSDVRPGRAPLRTSHDRPRRGLQPARCVGMEPSRGIRVLSQAHYGCWLIWGLLGALGAYTLPLMIYPVSALVVALLVRTVQLPQGSAERRFMVRGVLTGTLVCGTATLLLYLPILIEQGLGETYASRAISLKVYRDYFASHGPMLVAVWHSWMRHANIVWEVVLIVGFSAFLISAARRPNARHTVPLIMLLILPLLIWAQGLPIAPPGWMFLLPVFLACSMYGICALPNMLPRVLGRLPVAMIVIATTSLAGASTMATVSQQTYLSAWEHEFVDIERVLDECEAFGTQRCALVTRYLPARPYYSRRRGLSDMKSPADNGVERVFIAVGTLRSLGELWNEGVEGFHHYGSPRVLRRFARSTLYVADRVSLAGESSLFDPSPTGATNESGPPSD